MLKHILGNIPVIRILDFLIDNQISDHTRAEIAHYTQVGPTAMKEGFKCLEQCGIVIETRKIGGVPLYVLDMENKMTQSLIKFDEALTDYCTDKILDAEVKKIEEVIGEEEYDEEYAHGLPEPPED
jgi:DNA-binding transcriptional regulator YhcF (GntR family)